MIKGEIIFPKKIPNLNHKLFNGVSNLESIKPNTKNIKATTNAQIRYVLTSCNGQNPIIINTAKKTMPKLLFELFFTTINIKNFKLSL